jgi:preprotein translocase subunit SecG
MHSVVLVIHLIIALAIIILVLLQRSEGGGLGIGGSGGMGNFATPRATADFMTRLTGILGGCFFVTSLLLAIFAGGTNPDGKSILDAVPSAPAAAPLTPEGGAPAVAPEANTPSAPVPDAQAVPSAPTPSAESERPSAPIGQ